MRNPYLSLSLLTLLSVLYSPAYAAEPLPKYAVSNCKINMLSEPLYNSNRSSWIGMTTISGCKTEELPKQE